MDPFYSPNSTTPTSTRRTQFLVCLKMTPLTQKSDRLLRISMIRLFQCQPYVLGLWVRYSKTLTFVKQRQRPMAIGIVWAILISVCKPFLLRFTSRSAMTDQGLNQFFYFRYPSVEITSVRGSSSYSLRSLKSTLGYQIVAQLLAFPIGRAWAKFVPNVRIFGMELNPGPFSIKEHVREFSLRFVLPWVYD